MLPLYAFDERNVSGKVEHMCLWAMAFVSYAVVFSPLYLLNEGAKKKLRILRYVKYNIE